MLAQILNATSERHASQKALSSFEFVIVHVATGDETAAETELDKYRAAYPHVQFECVHLRRALRLKSIDWTVLPKVETIEGLFDALPTVTSKADVLRLLIRHVLIDVARERDCSTLLLGHSTTALAALTLSGVANGRGFSVPMEVNDGMHDVCSYENGKEVARVPFPIYYPLREVFKNELFEYMKLLPEEFKGLEKTPETGSVVSHRDVSIEEVMQRYFEGVEGQYSGIVANVVRTTGKLDRVTGTQSCRLCGMALDETGEERWAGELGEATDGGHLCYGCRRSVNG